MRAPQLEVQFTVELFGWVATLRARLAEGMPAYGCCAGMILLGREVLDGRPDQQQLAAPDVVVRRNAFGRQVDSFEADLDFAGVPGGPVRGVFLLTGVKAVRLTRLP